MRQNILAAAAVTVPIWVKLILWLTFITLVLSEGGTGFEPVVSAFNSTQERLGMGWKIVRLVRHVSVNRNNSIGWLLAIFVRSSVMIWGYPLFHR